MATQLFQYLNTARQNVNYVVNGSLSRRRVECVDVTYSLQRITLEPLIYSNKYQSEFTQYSAFLLLSMAEIAPMFSSIFCCASQGVCVCVSACSYSKWTLRQQLIINSCWTESSCRKLETVYLRERKSGSLGWWEGFRLMEWDQRPSASWQQLSPLQQIGTLSQAYILSTCSLLVILRFTRHNGVQFSIRIDSDRLDTSVRISNICAQHGPHTFPCNIVCCTMKHLGKSRSIRLPVQTNIKQN